MTETDAHLNIKRYFLISLIIALSVSALIGIVIFLIGDFGDTEAQILLTTLSIGGYSLTGLCAATIFYKEHLKPFAVFGMVVSVLGFLTTVVGIWELVQLEDIWKPLVIFIILSFGTAHSSLLLLIEPMSDPIRYALYATLMFIAIVSFMLIVATLQEFENSEFFFRLLGVFAILDVLGTIATPLWNKVVDKNEE